MAEPNPIKFRRLCIWIRVQIKDMGNTVFI